MRLHNLFFVGLMAFAMMLFIGCQQDTGASETTATTVKPQDESSSGADDSSSPDSSDDSSDSKEHFGTWETWQTIDITEGKGTTSTNVSVSAPWNIDRPQNAFGADIAADIKKSDGWELILNTCAKEGYGAGRNYLIFYNNLLGIMRVFYYCDMEITGTGNEHFWEIELGKNEDRSSYYGQLPFGVPLNQSMNPVISGGQFETSNIFRQTVTNYQQGSNKTLAYKSWNCFELDMSAYSPTKFADANDQITFRLYATKTSNVSLESSLNAKLTGAIDIDKIEPPAASSGKGLFDSISTLKDFGKNIWNVGKAAFGLFSGNNILDNINTIAGAIPGLTTGVKGVVNMFGGNKDDVQTEPTYTPTYRGTVNMNLSGTIDTTGYINENGMSTDIPVFTVSSSNIPSDSKFGEGVWTLKDTPKIISFLDLRYYDGCYPDYVTMLDPESITLILRDDIKQTAKNIRVETVWGCMDDGISFSEYRAAIGISNAARDEYPGRRFYLTPNVEDMSQIKLLDGGLSDINANNYSGDRYHCLKMETQGKKFFAFTQNAYSTITQMIVVVRLQFELNGNKYVYTRRYLPEFVRYTGTQDKIGPLLDIRKSRKASRWKVDGVSYPVIQAELENLYNFYFDPKTHYYFNDPWYMKTWVPDEKYRD